MPRELSVETSKFISSEFKTQMFFTAVKITHPDIPEPILICDWYDQQTQLPMIHDGEQYDFIDFDFKRPDEKETGTPKATMTIGNVTHWLTPTIRKYRGDKFKVYVAIVTISLYPNTFDNTEIEWPPFDVSEVSYDENSATFTLNHETLFNQKWPRFTFNPWDFPGAYQ